MHTHAEHDHVTTQEPEVQRREHQGAQLLRLQGAAGNAAVSRMVSGGLTSLGSDSWQWAIDPKQRVVQHVYVGPAEAWKPYLRNMDDHDEFNRYLQGFLKYSNDPGQVGNGTSIWAEYRQTVTRAPNESEKLEFLKALYSLKDELDLWHGSIFESTESFSASIRDSALATFLLNNQGLLIRHVSEQGKVIDGKGVKAVATQGGHAATMAMIADAGASAFQGIGLALAARKRNADEQDRAAGIAMETIRNSGRVMRATLAAHNGRVTFNQSVVGAVFEAAWGLIPGGNTVLTAAKGILKTSLKDGITKLCEESAPNDQAERINDAFVEGCNGLARKKLISNRDCQDAINGFEAVRRPGVND